MKHIFCIYLFLILLQSGHTQIFRPYTSYFSLAIGSRSVLGTMIMNDISDGSELTGQTGPFNFEYEYGWNDHFGIGLHIAFEYTSLVFYSSHSNENASLQHGSFENWNTLIRFNYHPFSADKIDPYLGVGIGTRFQVLHGMSKEDIPIIYSGSIPEWFTVDCVFGMKYNFCPVLGIYTEFGLSKSPVQLGVTYAPGNSKKGKSRSRLTLPVIG